MKLIYFLPFLLVFFLVACQATTVPEQKKVEMLETSSGQEIETQELSNGVQGFLAKPTDRGDYPGVIMIHEWWGLNDNIKQMAETLAKEGYVVLAVDLYNGEVAADANRARELSAQVRNNPEKAIQEMKNAVAYLKEEQQVEKVASLGWCFGGGQALQLSLNEALDATIIYYGQLTDDPEQLKNIEGPVLGIFGEEDTSIPVQSVKDFEAALDELGIENRIYIYPGVGHAFANPSGASYAAEETLDAWDKTVLFLNDRLKGRI